MKFIHVQLSPPLKVHPSDIDNLQLAHWQCNRQKSDKLYTDERATDGKVIGNRNLPQSCDWQKYKS